jgi:flagellar hook-length control protein FliK
LGSSSVPASLQSSTQAAIPVAAITQDNQQTAPRNVATERSTTMSLGSVLAGPSETGTDTEADFAEQGRPRNGGRNSSDRAASLKPKPEQTSAATGPSSVESPLKAGPAESVPPLSTHERVRVVEQLAQKLDTMRIASGRQEVTVHLRPDHLGDLRVTIVADRQDVTTRVVADTVAARDAVHEGREQLRSALEQKGYSLQGLDVSLSGGSQRRMPQFEQEPARIPGSPAGERARQESQTSAADPGSGTRASLRAGRLDYQA